MKPCSLVVSSPLLDCTTLENIGLCNSCWSACLTRRIEGQRWNADWQRERRTSDSIISCTATVTSTDRMRLSHMRVLWLANHLSQKQELKRSVVRKVTRTWLTAFNLQNTAVCKDVISLWRSVIVLLAQERFPWRALHSRYWTLMFYYEIAGWLVRWSFCILFFGKVTGLVCIFFGLAVGCADNISELYWRSARFKPRSEHRLSWLRVLVVSTVHSCSCQARAVSYAVGIFLTLLFHFIILIMTSFDGICSYLSYEQRIIKATNEHKPHLLTRYLWLFS